MNFSMPILLNSVLLGVGLAMDAFSVSLANGLNENKMGTGRMLTVAGTFAGFQFVMPMLGWLCVHSIAAAFSSFQKIIPWIALILLLYIGGSMLYEGIKDTKKPTEEIKPEVKRVAFGALILQGIATSIDALSVGFTISDYDAMMAFVSALIIGIVTYIICLIGLSLGKKFGTKLAGKASILGGVILVGIGIEIWMSGVFF